MQFIFDLLSGFAVTYVNTCICWQHNVQRTAMAKYIFKGLFLQQSNWIQLPAGPKRPVKCFIVLVQGVYDWYDFLDIYIANWQS